MTRLTYILCAILIEADYMSFDLTYKAVCPDITIQCQSQFWHELVCHPVILPSCLRLPKSGVDWDIGILGYYEGANLPQLMPQFMSSPSILVAQFDIEQFDIMSRL